MLKTDVTPSSHAERIAHLRESFGEANARLVARLRGATDAAAERADTGAWSAAQIGWHVAAVTTRFARMISGEVAAAQPTTPNFRERAWTDVLASIPDRLTSPEAVAPPPAVRRAEAVAALEASGAGMAVALAALTPDRGDRMGITHPIVGAISVYQIGDWATAHVIRHNRQAKRALGEG